MIQDHYPGKDGSFADTPASPVYLGDDWSVLVAPEYDFIVDEALRAGLDVLIAQAEQEPNVEEARDMLARHHEKPKKAPTGEILLDPNNVELVIAGLRSIIRSTPDDTPSHGVRVLEEESDKLLVAILASVNTADFLQSRKNHP